MQTSQPSTPGLILQFSFIWQAKTSPLLIARNPISLVLILYSEFLIEPVFTGEYFNRFVQHTTKALFLYVQMVFIHLIIFARVWVDVNFVRGIDLYIEEDIDYNKYIQKMKNQIEEILPGPLETGTIKQQAAAVIIILQVL